MIFGFSTIDSGWPTIDFPATIDYDRRRSDSGDFPTIDFRLSKILTTLATIDFRGDRARVGRKNARKNVKIRAKIARKSVIVKRFTIYPGPVAWVRVPSAGDYITYSYTAGREICPLRGVSGAGRVFIPLEAKTLLRAEKRLKIKIPRRDPDVKKIRSDLDGVKINPGRNPRVCYSLSTSIKMISFSAYIYRISLSAASALLMGWRVSVL